VHLEPQMRIFRVGVTHEMYNINVPCVGSSVFVVTLVLVQSSGSL
jgi:hypothetical protein